MARRRFVNENPGGAALAYSATGGSSAGLRVTGFSKEIFPVIWRALAPLSRGIPG
jgi:hypothetical protein